jgi:stage II sporulation protein E
MQSVTEVKDKLHIKEKIKSLGFKSYIIYAVFSFIVGRSVVLGEISPFIFGFLAFAVLDTSQKITPVFALIGTLTLGDVSLSIRAAIVLALLYVARYANIFTAKKLHKAIIAFVCTAAASVVIFLAMSGSAIDIILYSAEAISAFCMHYVFSIGIDAFRTYRQRQVFGDEEIICISIILIVIITALNGLVFYNYNIMVIFAIFAILFSVHFEGIKAALPVAVLTSLSLVLAQTADMSIMAVYTFGALLACVGIKINKTIAALSFILGMLVIFGCINGFSGLFLFIKEALAASVLFIALPIYKKEDKIEQEETQKKEKGKEAFNIYIKHQMQKQRAAQNALYIKNNRRKSTDKNKAILGYIIKDVCSSCQAYNNCWTVNSENTMMMFIDSLKKYGNEKAMERTEFIKSCSKPELMKLSINYLIKSSFEQKDRQKQLERQREYFLTKQQSLIELSEEIFDILQNGIIKHEEEEKSIISSLKRQDIDCGSVFVFSDRRGIMRVFISMAKSNISRQVRCAMSDCIYSSVGIKVDFDSEYKTQEGCVCLFVESPLMRLSVAQKKAAKKYSDYSGDSSTVADIDKGLVLAAIADGMGSGRDAQNYSGRLLDIIEDLLGSGIDIKTAVHMANGVMETDDEKEIFSTLDALLFDEYTSDAVIIKAGACATYIKSEKGIEKIEFDTTPIGILNKPNIKTAYRNLGANSYIYMFSDGFASAFEDKELKDLIKKTSGRSPQMIADNIFEEFKQITHDEKIDDITIMVAKVWERL